MRLRYYDDFERMGVKAVERALIANLFMPSASTQARIWLACRPGTPANIRRGDGSNQISRWISALAALFAALVSRGGEGA